MPQIMRDTELSRNHKILGIVIAAFIIVAAFFMKLPSTMRSGTYTIFRESYKQKTLWTTRQMDTLIGEHFIIRYAQGGEKDAELVLSTAEKFYRPIAEKYGYTSRTKIPVIVYGSRAELNRNFGWPANESAMGVYWAGVIRVLSPKVWVTEQDPELYKDEFITSGPMAHEFTHLAVDYVTGGNYTRWFTEGLAQYEEFKLTGFEFDDSSATLDQPLYQLNEMDTNFDNLPNQPLAYRQSYLAVRYIAEVYGEEHLRYILQNLSKDHKMDKALINALGIDIGKFEINYQEWAKEQDELNQL